MSDRSDDARDESPRPTPRDRAPGARRRATRPDRGGVGPPAAVPPAARAQRTVQFFVCGRCFGVLGAGGGRRQWCDCAPAEAHRRAREDALHRRGTSWTRLIELCRCCGAAAVPADHKFAVWFCDPCKTLAAEANRAVGSCAIPIGWHSVVNGVFTATNRRKQLPQLTAFADQLGAFFRESGDTWTWGRQIVARHWKAAGLPARGRVELERYLSATGALGVDPTALFEELRAARGLPDHWRDLADVPFSLVWNEAPDGSFEALEWIPYEYPEGGEVEVDDARLLLVVHPGDGGPIRWSVVLGEEAERPDPVLEEGASPNAAAARRDCEAAALRHIAEAERRLGA